MTALATILSEIDFALDSWVVARRKSKHDDLSDLSERIVSELVTTLSSTIERWAPPGSPFAKRASDVLRTMEPSLYFKAHEPLYGILKSLRQAYERGYLGTIIEAIHADMFADFLEMAEHLLVSGYKDPAAVLVGGVLEEHLRKLCLKHSIPIANASGDARKASQMNDDLAKVAYDKLPQKAVTYWLDVRNKAAHGKYTEYDDKVVQQVLTGVRDFVIKFPA